MADVQNRRVEGRLAQAVATAPAAPSASSSDTEVWLFCIRLMSARYAVEASLVREVVRLGPLTRLPAAPGFLPGVFTHRGEVLAVVDIQQLVGQAAIQINSNTRAAIAHCGSWKVALVTEGIEGLVCLPSSAIELPPAATVGAAEFLSGVGRDKKGELAILDLRRLVEVARARSVAP